MQINESGANYEFHLSTDRIDGNVREGQKKLNMLVVADSTPFIPFQQGQLRSQVRYPKGIYEPYVQWYAPYAHYQYEGELYLTPDGRSWANKDEKKYPTGTPLNYHTAGTGDHWFEQAKAQNLKKWEREVGKVVGKK